MQKVKPILWLLGLLAVTVFTGCGSSGGSNGNDSASTPGGNSGTAVRSGIAVDPYIVGARFEEVSADGTRIIQNSSTASDSQGRFSFANPIGENSIIRIKSSSRGMHSNSSFAGILKRQVGSSDNQVVVVSPLTTLLANGMSEDGVLGLLEAAGLNGLDRADLISDPMQGLVGVTGGISDAQLRGLKANMAVNTLLLALNDFDYAGQEQSPVNFSDCVALSEATLNTAAFQKMAAVIASGGGGNLTFDEFTDAAVAVQSTVVSKVRQELTAGSSEISAAQFVQLRSEAVTQLSTIADEILVTRVGDSTPPVVDPPTDPVPPSFSAESFFTGNCAGCHNLGTSSSVMNLAGDGALVNGKFGGGSAHNGNTLSADEILAMAEYFDAAVATEPPPVPLTGSELYASECQGCHGSLATTSISDRSTTGISTAIGANAGGMGSLILSAEQIALIVDSLPVATVPTTPPPERTGVDVYDQECSVCHMLGSHDTAGNIDLASRGAAIIAKIEGGHNGKVLSASELASLADYANTFGIAPPPVVARTPETIYNDICTTCHMLSGYDEAGAVDLAGKGSTAVTKVAGGHGASLSNTELTDLATWLDSFNPPPPPVVARDGEAIYTQVCSACHKLFGYDTVGNIDLASMGSTAVTKLAAGHGGTLSADEQLNIADWLDTWAPAPPPLVDRSGETVYNDICAACHKLNGYDNAGNVDLAGQGGLATTKLATGHGGSLTGGEVINLTDWLDTFSPAPPPIVARGGQEVYDTECSGCHKVNGFDAAGSAPDIAGNGSGAVIKINGGHNGVNLLAAELTNLSAWLNTFQAGDPYAGSCTACHGQPPQIGAHEVHTSLAGVGTNCAVCHETAGHNGSIDLAIQSAWNAKSGAASSTGTSCSNVRCHGGQTTPDWLSGSLDSSTQCKSCHVSGTSQYNGYSSGQHNRHVVSKRYDCLVCHDATKLGSGHFSGLATISFEQSPATTLKSSINYTGSSCNPSCHGSERW